MNFPVIILFTTLSSQVFAQSQETNDTVAVYRKVLKGIFQDEKVITITAGRVVFADIYGNYDEIRRRDDSAMYAQGYIGVIWVEPERYQESIARIMRENKFAFDTIKLEDLVWAQPVDLRSVLSTHQVVKNDKAPLEYSFFDNFFKEKRAIRLSELLFVKGLDVAVVKAKIENRNNKGEWFEMIVLRKKQNEWKILGRTKSRTNRRR